MGNFKIGDVVEFYQDCPFYPEFIGLEATIVSSLQVAFLRNRNRLGEGYDVEMATGGSSFALPHQIRLKRPPNNDFIAGDWDLIPWSPYRVGETS